MKIPLRSIHFDDKALDDYNRMQVETVRAEAKHVKDCYTSQSHYTLMLCTAIIGLGARFSTDLKDNEFAWISVMIVAAAAIFLCEATIAVGCHKYNTANRALGYEVHLARVIEYYEYNKAYRLSDRELRRIDWEEAMFAWRIVQPVIYEFFYRELKRFGVALQRFKVDRTRDAFRWPDFASEEPKNVQDAVKNYPWYDSKELLRGNNFKETIEELGFPHSAAVSAQFYPGAYLRKSIKTLLTIVAIFYIVLIVAGYKLCTMQGVIGCTVVMITIAIITYYAVVSSFNRWWRINTLEAGLLSIQTSAFVWRIVCLAHLRALHHTKPHSVQMKRSSLQLYERYTLKLAAVACVLRTRLHDIHGWLDETEAILNGLQTTPQASDGAVNPPPTREAASFSRKLSDLKKISKAFCYEFMPTFSKYFSRRFESPNDPPVV